MQKGYRISISRDLLKGAQKLPQAVHAKFNGLVLGLMSNPEAAGINFETVEGAGDRRVKSFRVDQAHRVIAFVEDGIVLLAHVDAHDPAYEWARGRKAVFNGRSNAVEIVEIVERTMPAPVEAAKQLADEPATVPLLFAHLSDADLRSVGVLPERLPIVRALKDDTDLDAHKDDLPATVFEGLICLAAGYDLADVPLLIGLQVMPAAEPGDFGSALATAESQREFWIPESETELSRILDAPLEAWRIFLHPDQRRLVRMDAKGPVLVRGGAGTGKTVVAMHRARWLAENLCTAPGDRVLFTTFTANLAADIRANLETLCPELMKKDVIEVKNLDAWVGGFLKQQGYERRIAYFGEANQEIEAIWNEVGISPGLPDGLSLAFTRDEWRDVVQAQALKERKDYLFAQRTGRGTPINRQTRARLWDVFEAFRARLVEASIAEPDDAYRDASAILTSRPGLLPYKAVVMDEAQDMGSEAFRLVRAIVPKRDPDSNTIFLVGDAYQRIYRRKASLKACGIDVQGRSRRLKVNYRTSEEIRLWATNLLDGLAVDDMDGGADTHQGYHSVFRGPSPIVNVFLAKAAEITALIAWVGQLQASGVDPKDIGILAKTNDLVRETAEALSNAGLPNCLLRPRQAEERSKPGVRLGTMHRAKGLEFDSVAIVGLNDGIVPFKRELDEASDAAEKRRVVERERSLVHVAATRAKRRLYVSSSGNLSNIVERKAS
jgi:superfamily I DNA/RNA helicase